MTYPHSWALTGLTLKRVEDEAITHIKTREVPTLPSGGARPIPTVATVAIETGSVGGYRLKDLPKSPLQTVATDADGADRQGLTPPRVTANEGYTPPLW